MLKISVYACRTTKNIDLLYSAFKVGCFKKQIIYINKYKEMLESWEETLFEKEKMEKKYLYFYNYKIINDKYQ